MNHICVKKPIRRATPGREPRGRVTPWWTRPLRLELAIDQRAALALKPNLGWLALQGEASGRHDRVTGA